MSEAQERRGRIYVSGPMTGYPDLNFPAFNAAADKLEAEGWDVENPADKGIVEGWEWEDYLRYDVKKVSDCDAIYLLVGWEESKGSRLEWYIASALGLRMIFEQVEKS